MAMSSSERLRYIQQEANRFVGLNKVRDSSELTWMNQVKAAAGTVFPRNVTLSNQSIQYNTTTSNFGLVENGISKNGVGTASETNPCCTTAFTSGSQSFAGQDALINAEAGCTLCSGPNYNSNNALAVDLTTLGLACCIDRTKPPFSQNTAQLTGFSSPVTSCPTSNNFVQYFPSNPTFPSCPPAQVNVSGNAYGDNPSLITLKFNSASSPL